MTMTYHNDGTYTSGDSVENIELQGKTTKTAKRATGAPTKRPTKKPAGSSSAGFDLSKLKSTVKSGGQPTDSVGSQKTQAAKETSVPEGKNIETSAATILPTETPKEKTTEADHTGDPIAPRAAIENPSVVETPKAVAATTLESTGVALSDTVGSSTDVSSPSVSEITLGSMESTARTSEEPNSPNTASSVYPFNIVCLDELFSSASESVEGAALWVKRACTKSASAADSVFSHGTFKVYAVRFVRDSAIALIGVGDQLAAAEYSYSKDHLSDATAMLSTKGAFVYLSNTPIITAEYKTRSTREV